MNVLILKGFFGCPAELQFQTMSHITGQSNYTYVPAKLAVWSQYLE